MQGVFAAYYERGLVGCGQGPTARLGGKQVELRAIPVVKAPLAADDADQLAGGQRRGGLLEDEAAFGGVGDHWQIDRTGCRRAF